MCVIIISKKKKKILKKGSCMDMAYTAMKKVKRIVASMFWFIRKHVCLSCLNTTRKMPV